MVVISPCLGSPPEIPLFADLLLEVFSRASWQSPKAPTPHKVRVWAPWGHPVRPWRPPLLGLAAPDRIPARPSHRRTHAWTQPEDTRKISAMTRKPITKTQNKTQTKNNTKKYNSTSSTVRSVSACVRVCVCACVWACVHLCVSVCPSLCVCVWCVVWCVVCAVCCVLCRCLCYLGARICVYLFTWTISLLTWSRQHLTPRRCSDHNKDSKKEERTVEPEREYIFLGRKSQTTRTK